MLLAAASDKVELLEKTSEQQRALDEAKAKSSPRAMLKARAANTSRRWLTAAGALGVGLGRASIVSSN